MPVPKQRHTKSRRNKRRSHHALKSVKLISCSKCGTQKLPHRYCPNCGTYRDREIIDVLAKLTKKEKKAKLAEQEAHKKSAEMDLKQMSQK